MFHQMNRPGCFIRVFFVEIRSVALALSEQLAVLWRFSSSLFMALVLSYLIFDQFNMQLSIHFPVRIESKLNQLSTCLGGS